jgi:thioredoxin
MRFHAFILIGLILAALSAGGCVLGTHADRSAETAAAIDAALADGPVLIDFGASWCSWCTKEKPILEELSLEYSNVTFIDVDVDENGSIADAYYVSGIPQMNVIVRKNADGSYLYADISGQTTDDRKASAIVGYTEMPDLKKTLDAAIKARG